MKTLNQTESETTTQDDLDATLSLEKEWQKILTTMKTKTEKETILREELRVALIEIQAGFAEESQESQDAIITNYFNEDLCEGREEFNFEVQDSKIGYTTHIVIEKFQDDIDAETLSLEKEWNSEIEERKQTMNN